MSITVYVSAQEVDKIIEYLQSAKSKTETIYFHVEKRSAHPQGIAGVRKILTIGPQVFGDCTLLHIQNLDENGEL